MPGQFNPADYEPVQDRIARFWREHPDGAILTNLQSDPANFEACRYKAEIYVADRLVATGWAFEKVGRAANATHHEENAETSAIGRALANMGYAASADKRPSREEIGKVVAMPARTANAPQSPAQAPQNGTDAASKAAFFAWVNKSNLSQNDVLTALGTDSTADWLKANPGKTWADLQQTVEDAVFGALSGGAS